MAFLSKFIGTRLRKKESEAIKELLEKYPEKYLSKSHVIRCAIIYLLEDERRSEENEEYRRTKYKRA